MKKGDLRKQEILRTAEQLFCRKGYEQTSIQDILDQLQTSKGSFYHHFVSKDALLETLCAQRAAQSKEITLSETEICSKAGDQLNRLLTGMIPFHDEKLAFLLMLLPVFALYEGKRLRISYCDSLRVSFHGPVCDAIEAGIQTGELHCEDPDVYADIIISIVNHLWTAVCDVIIENETKGCETDPAELLHITEQYRTAAERILYLPYGSLVLIDIPQLKDLEDQIHIHWLNNPER